jgi:hypothetical protein
MSGGNVMKNILVIVDKGDVYEITGTTFQTDEYIVDDEMVKEIPMDDQGIQVFQYIKEKLDTHQIQYPKDISGRLIIEDLLVNEYDKLQLYKSKVIMKGKEYLSTRLNVHTIFEFFDFIMCNNILAASGIVITEKNRRQKYLEIIDTGDIELIDALETYLNSLDRMKIINGWYRTYKEFDKNVNNSETKEQIDEHYKVFVQIYE